jgi:hypothetical protein
MASCLLRLGVPLVNVCVPMTLCCAAQIAQMKRTAAQESSWIQQMRAAGVE